MKIQFTNSMPSILFVSLMNDFSWASTEELWYKSALYAKSKGHSVTCACFEWPEKKNKIEELKSNGCDLFLFPNKGRSKKNLFEKLQYRSSRASLKKCLETLPINNFDIIIINVTSLEITDPIFKDWYKRFNNYFLLFHESEIPNTFKQPEISILKNWMCNASKNLFVSEKFKINLENLLNFHIPNSDDFINPISFPIPASSTPTVKQNHYVFSMITSLDINVKAQDKLIKALASPKWMQRNFILNIYGDGKDYDRLDNYINRKGLSKKIFLKGYTKDVKQALLNSSLILQITHHDSMPIIILEAMAMSRPVIVSDVGNMTKWVRHSVNGWITKDASVDEIEIALELAWNERNHWEEMGRKSYQIFIKKYPAPLEKSFLNKIGITGEMKNEPISKAIKA